MKSRSACSAFMICATSRRELVDDYDIGRVIARPFVGDGPDTYVRTGNRRDLTTPPHADTVLDKLVASGGDVVSVGKIADIYAHRGITKKVKATGNAALFDATLDADARSRRPHHHIYQLSSTSTCCSATGATQTATRRRWNTSINVSRSCWTSCSDDDVLFLCADHGCDPTRPGSDHTREHIPVLAYGAGVTAGALGKRETFADIGQSIATFFDLPPTDYGTSFL